MLRVDSFDEDAEFYNYAPDANQPDSKKKFEMVDIYEKDEFKKTGLYSA